MPTFKTTIEISFTAIGDEQDAHDALANLLRPLTIGQDPAGIVKAWAYAAGEVLPERLPQDEPLEAGPGGPYQVLWTSAEGRILVREAYATADIARSAFNSPAPAGARWRELLHHGNVVIGRREVAS